uniref:Fe uptake system integral membrane protein n=1 Tax=Streptomyces coelicolor TaxID=1902 RepID=Q9X471_STRCH|nr:Fe uptake system integral membrane protein [Streptomyces coelicolor A3(2)]
MTAPVSDADIGQAVKPGNQDDRRAGPAGLAVTLVVLTVLLVVSATAGLAIGSVQVPPGQVWGIVTHALGADWSTPDWSNARETIVLDVRAPRVLLGGVAGAGLAVVAPHCRALIQSLAEPYLLGVSSCVRPWAPSGGDRCSGVNPARTGIASSAAAFAGALGALLLVYATARTGGRITSSSAGSCPGVAIAAVLTAVLDLLLLTTDRGNEARQVLAWTLGGLGGVNWDTLWLPSAALLLGIAVLMVQARNLNLLLAGEEGSDHDGAGCGRFRARMFVLLSLVTGILVAACGPIGFVGLMLPHIVRLIVGGDHRRVLPTAALGGAVFLIWADIAARIVAAPMEIPVGVLTALCGGPFFLWLMRRDARRNTDRGGA